MGDKVSDGEKAPVKAAIEKLKETVKSGDVPMQIKADTEALEKAFYRYRREAVRLSRAALRAQIRARALTRTRALRADRRTARTARTITLITRIRPANN